MGIKDEDLGFFAPERRPIKVSYFLGLVIQYNNLGVLGRREGFMTAATAPSRDQNFFITINPEGSRSSKKLSNISNPEGRDSIQTCALIRVRATWP